MIQLAVQANNGEPGARRYLDLYETQPIKLTLSIEDITTTDTTAVYSQTFRIPATGNNSQFFVTAFDINGFDFDVSQKQSAELIVDGDIYQSGEIRLLKVFIDEQSNQVDYEILFLGTTRNLASSIGESALCDLDLTSLNHDFTKANVVSSWLAYPQGGLTDGLINGDIVYPLIDFGNTYNDANIVQETRIAKGGGSHFTQNTPAGRLHIDRLRPAVRCKVIWDKIFENAGYTYTSNFLDSNLFKHLYIGAFGDSAELIPNYSVSATNTSNLGGILSAEVKYKINSGQEGFDFTNEWYVVPTTGNYDAGARLFIDAEYSVPANNDGSVEFKVRLYKDVGGVPTQLAETLYEWEVFNPSLVLEGSFYSYGSIPVNFENIPLTAGDKIYATIEKISSLNLFSAVISSNVSFLSVSQTTANNPAVGFDCKFKQMDFIKGIIAKFRLVIAPDRNIPTNFIIEPWSNYIGSGDQFDWTNKMDLSKDIQVEPILYTQKANITFEDKPGEDFLNLLNQQDIGEVYGTLNYVSNNPLLKDTRKIETKFEAIPSIQIDGASTGTNGMWNTIIPQIHDHDTAINESTGQAYLLHNPVKAGTRIFWYDGLITTGITATNDDTWYLTDDGGIGSGFATFPMISQFSEWGDYNSSWGIGLDTQTRDISWQRENTYIKGDLANPNLGNSVYDEYWSRYTNLLYDPYSRRITMYLKLDKFDLINFSFDDAIFLKNGWYYIEKIYSVDLVNETSVKVDLIRLNNFTVSDRGFLPPSGLPQLWEDVDDEWQDITDNWEAV